MTDPAIRPRPEGDVADPRLTAEDLVEATGGRAPRPLRPADPRRRGRLPRGRARATCSSPCRASGSTVTPSSARALAAGAAAAIVARPPDGVDARRPSTRRSSRSTTRCARSRRSRPSWRRRFDPLVVGVTGSIAKTSTKEAIATVLASALVDAEERGQPEQRDRAAADRPPPAPRPPGRGPRDGHVRRRRDRRAGRDRPAGDRRRDRGPAGPPVADRDDRGDRAGEGRARRGAAAGRRRDPQRRRRAGPPDGVADRRPGRDLRLRAATRRPRGGGRVGRRRRDARSTSSRTARAGRSTIPTLGRLAVHNALAAAAVGLAVRIPAGRGSRRRSRSAGRRRIAARSSVGAA